MSFGFSIGDFILLTNLARHTVDNAREACGAHDSLTREVNSLHVVLQRLQLEVSKPDSILNRTEDNRRNELGTLARDCRRVLNVLSSVLEKYNALSEEKRSVTKLWKQVRFGNGEMRDIGKIRTELATYTQAITLFLNLLAMGELGKVGRYMETNGEELRDIKNALHWVISSSQAKNHEEKSILTSYTDDDKSIWKDFRRELIMEGFDSRILRRHQEAIKMYVLELGNRGALDAPLTEHDDLPPALSEYEPAGRGKENICMSKQGSQKGTDTSVLELSQTRSRTLTPGGKAGGCVSGIDSGPEMPVAPSSASQVNLVLNSENNNDLGDGERAGVSGADLFTSGSQPRDMDDEELTAIQHLETASVHFQQGPIELGGDTTALPETRSVSHLVADDAGSRTNANQHQEMASLLFRQEPNQFECAEKLSTMADFSGSPAEYLNSGMSRFGEDPKRPSDDLSSVTAASWDTQRQIEIPSRAIKEHYDSTSTSSDSSAYTEWYPSGGRDSEARYNGNSAAEKYRSNGRHRFYQYKVLTDGYITQYEKFLKARDIWHAGLQVGQVELNHAASHYKLNGIQARRRRDIFSIFK